MSTISKHLQEPIAAVLGREIKRRRLARGLTQAQLGHPLTRGFVCAVETGRCVPSISVLLLMAERLEVSPGSLLDAVKPGLVPGYTAADATSEHSTVHGALPRTGS